MHHAGADEAEIDLFLCLVVGDGPDRVVGISLGYIDIVHIGIGNHRLIDLIQVDDDFGEILGAIVRSQSRLLAGFDFGNALIRLGDQTFQDLGIIVHALLDHDLNAALGDFEGLDEGVILGNTDGCLCLHLGGPVREREGLVGQQRSDMDFDNPSLENVVAKLFQHLRLRLDEKLGRPCVR